MCQGLEPSLPLLLLTPAHALDASSGPIPGPVPRKQCEAVFLFLGGVGAEDFLYGGDKRARLG